MKDRILILGCGSIGERHLRCFQRTGRAEPIACDTNVKLLEKIQSQYQVRGHNDFKTALETEEASAAVICTPANTHLAIAQECLRHGIDLLIEKPLSVGLEGVDAFQQVVAGSGRFVAVAFVYHFQPGLKAVHDVLRAGRFGRPLQVSVNCGQHFPTYRPAYRDIYYNRHETGGGAIQDMLPHLVNAVEWLIGPSTRVFAEAAHQALEGVTVEDTVSVAARNGDVLVTYALNQFQPPNEATFAVHCEGGSLKAELHEQRWGIWPRGADAWQYHPAPVKERDDLFVAQANAFLDALEGKATDLSTVEEAIQTLKSSTAALKSARAGAALLVQQQEIAN